MQSTNDYRSRARVNNPYAQQDDGPTYGESNYQAPSVVPSTTNLTGGGDSMTAFYSEVSTRRPHVPFVVLLSSLPNALTLP